MKGSLILLFGVIGQSYASPTVSARSVIGSNPIKTDFTMGELFILSKRESNNNKNLVISKNNPISQSSSIGKTQLPKSTSNDNKGSHMDTSSDSPVGTKDTVIDTEAQKAVEDATEHSLATSAMPRSLIVGSGIGIMAVIGGLIYYKHRHDTLIHIK